MILNPEFATDLEEIKKAMREDFSEDDTGIRRAANAAIFYIKGAVGVDKSSFYAQDGAVDELINLAILLLADHYYHARSATVESSEKLQEYDLGFRTIILQIKAHYLAFEEA